MAKTQVTEDQIRETAYLIWLDEGQPHGQDEAHWLKAIDALTPAKPKRKAAAKPKASTAKKPRATKAKAKVN